MEIRTRKNGTKAYRDSIYLNGIKKRSPTFSRKIDLIQWKANALAKREIYSRTGLRDYSDMSFEELVSMFMSNKSSLSDRTIESYNGILTKWLLPFYSNETIASISMASAEKLKHKLRDKGLSISRTNNILILLNAIMKYAVSCEYATRNPLINLKTLKKPQAVIQYWNKEDCSIFVNSLMDEHYRDFYVLAINTGMRLGEICGLCFDSVFLSRRLIEVKRTMSRGRILQNSTKSKKSRLVPMNDIVYETLKRIIAKPKHNQFVFTNRKNEPVDYEHFTQREFYNVLKKIDLPKIPFKGLRSTFATNFCMGDRNIFALSKILGHGSVSVTEKRYATLDPKYLVKEISSFSLQ